MKTDSDDKHSKAIADLPVLVPPGTDSKVTKVRHNNQSKVLITLAVIMIILMLIIIFLLINTDRTQKNTIEVNNVSSVSNEEHIAVQADVQQFNNIENLINQWLILKAEARQEQLSQWAEKDYIQALSEVQQAEEYIKKSQYKSAVISYQKAISIIQQIKQSKPIELEHIISRADNALASEDWKTARQLYENALLIEPENERAFSGLSRATNYPQVMDLYNHASRLFSKHDNNDIKKNNEVISILEKTVDLDKDYQPAVQLLNEVRKKNDQLIFKQYITEIFKNLELNKYSKSRKLLSKASEIDSKDPVIEDLGLRIDDAEKKYKIGILRQAAQQQEKQEQWPAQINTYNKILSIEADAVFAIQGKQKAVKYNQWHEKLDNIIEHPDRLQSDVLRKKTRDWVSSITKQSGQLSAQHKKLQNKLLQANSIIAASSIDIDLTIVSDNKTQIHIYKVGKLGSFNEKTISLKPGNYTVLGSRSGYRDVRLTISIKAKDKNPQLTVICEEVI